MDNQGFQSLVVPTNAACTFPTHLSLERRCMTCNVLCDTCKKLLILNNPAIAATCIYLSCRIMQCPRVLEEIALGTGTDVSLIQRMQSDILKGMSMVVRITKSGDIFLRFAQRCLERLHLRQCEDIRTSATPLTHQLVLSLPYLCLEEGINLCERIAEYELLTENIAPKAVVGAVL
eukprot:gene17476-20853_t